MSIQSEIERIKGHVADVYEAVAYKGGTLPNTQTSANMFQAVQSIPTNTGVEVKIATGTVTVSGSNTSVTCNFKPDAVFFTGTNTYTNTAVHAGVAFKEANVTSMITYFTGSSSSYVMSSLTVTQTSTGFQVKGVRLNTSLKESNESNRRIDYIAIKYTE